MGLFRTKNLRFEYAKGKWYVIAKPSKVRRLLRSDNGERLQLLRHALVQYGIFTLVLTLSPLLLSLRFLCRPFTNIRVGLLEYSRVGHLAAHTELYLRRRPNTSNRKGNFDIFLTGIPANHQLLRMFKRHINVIQHPICPIFYWALRIVLGWSGICLRLPFYGDEFDEFDDVNPSLSFTEEEEKLGRELLSEMGIPAGAPFVCIFARDNEYLNQTHPDKNNPAVWEMHNHRNTDIDSLLKSADYLADRGIYTVRMGQVVEKPLRTSNPKIIDYATFHRTDFGDVYLVAKCSFFLGCTSGIITVAQIFNVPIAWTNLIPLWHLPLGNRDIFIPKTLVRTEDSQQIRFPEIMESGMYEWYESSWYEEAGISVVENSSDEILELTKEMLGRLYGLWDSCSGDEEIQNQFRELFPEGHISHGFKSRIGSNFIREYVSTKGAIK